MQLEKQNFKNINKWNVHFEWSIIVIISLSYTQFQFQFIILLIQFSSVVIVQESFILCIL